jgi:hypothetical protein
MGKEDLMKKGLLDFLRGKADKKTTDDGEKFPLPEEAVKKKVKSPPMKADVFHQDQTYGWPGPGVSPASRVRNWVRGWRDRR